MNPNAFASNMFRLIENNLEQAHVKKLRPLQYFLHVRIYNSKDLLFQHSYINQAM